jgi:hypothetical protein
VAGPAGLCHVAKGEGRGIRGVLVHNAVHARVHRREVYGVLTAGGT